MKEVTIKLTTAQYNLIGAMSCAKNLSMEEILNKIVDKGLKDSVKWDYLKEIINSDIIED